MRGTSIIGTAVVMTAFFISCDSHNNKLSNNSKGKRCVESVLSIDEKLGEIRNHECEKVSLSETIDHYVFGLQDIDFNDCPIEFKRAFEHHIQAWISITVITDKYPEKRGELHDIFDELSQSEDSAQFNAYVKEIWKTWEEVERSTE